MNQVLPQVFKEMGLEEELWQMELKEAWPALVGEQLAARTRPGRVERGTLVVFVEHAGWLSELSRYGKREMLARLQERYGRQRIRFLRLELDPGS